MFLPISSLLIDHFSSFNLEHKAEIEPHLLELVLKVSATRWRRMTCVRACEHTHTHPHTHTHTPTHPHIHPHTHTHTHTQWLISISQGESLIWVGVVNLDLLEGTPGHPFDLSWCGEFPLAFLLCTLPLLDSKWLQAGKCEWRDHPGPRLPDFLVVIFLHLRHPWFDTCTAWCVVFDFLMTSHKEVCFKFFDVCHEDQWESIPLTRVFHKDSFFPALFGRSQMKETFCIFPLLRTFNGTKRTCNKIENHAETLPKRLSKTG